MIWDGHRLTYGQTHEQLKAARRRNAMAGVKAREAKRPGVVKARRARVTELHGQGKTISEIAYALSEPYWKIGKDLSALQLKANAPKPTSHDADVKRQRVDMLRAGFAKGETIASMARRSGISASTLGGIARREGLTGGVPA